LIAAVVAGIGYECFANWLQPPGTVAKHLQKFGYDMELLKVDTENLAALPIADYDTLRQGELVFAFGSPEGLRDSVTMGIVSAVARQADPDSPLVYIQTDASINRGNSGGPLVNVKGELVGINTFIISDSGGSQGLGFAIPSALVQMAYPKLRKYGHLHRGEIGILMQTITPTIATGLGLSQTWGALVSDVNPETPAAAARTSPARSAVHEIFVIVVSPSAE
jgi:serine protease Do